LIRLSGIQRTFVKPPVALTQPTSGPSRLLAHQQTDEIGNIFRVADSLPHTNFGHIFICESLPQVRGNNLNASLSVKPTMTALAVVPAMKGRDPSSTAHERVRDSRPDL